MVDGSRCNCGILSSFHCLLPVSHDGNHEAVSIALHAWDNLDDG